MHVGTTDAGHFNAHESFTRSRFAKGRILSNLERLLKGGEHGGFDGRHRFIVLKRSRAIGMIRQQGNNDEEVSAMPIMARDVVQNYYEAWTRSDISAARAYLADDLDFEGSIDRFTAAEPFTQALASFSGMLKEVRLLHEFYAEDSAALLYDCVTSTPGVTVRTAEFFRVKDGKIREIRLVFDATELRRMLAR